MKAGTTRFKDHMNLNCMFSKTVGFKTAVCAVLAALVISAGVPVSATDTEIPVKEPGYTLTPVEEPGTNTITKFEWNAEENKLTAVHYRVDLAKTEYGYKDAAGATAYYYKWVDNGNGLEFEQTTDPSEAQITYYADPNRLAPDRISTNQSVNTINNDFIGHSHFIAGNWTAPAGGAISNSNGSIGNITGDFIGNYVSGTLRSSGGAIYNYRGTIGDITGNFIGNHASGTFQGALTGIGGAICNHMGTIGGITGDFTGNYAYGSGGAIYNNGGVIGDITGDFVGNYAYTGAGGAIYNVHDEHLQLDDATIGNIRGNFINNLAIDGGAIYNADKIGDITGVFINNHTGARVDDTTFSTYGGAILNKGIIGDIKADFKGNYTYTPTVGEGALGGAIFNQAGSINSINGNFVSNFVKTSASGSSVGLAHALGGAIYNEEGLIGNVTGSFLGNSAFSEKSSASGGAIYNYMGGIASITGIFTENYVSSYYDAQGGSIYNSGIIAGYDVPLDKIFQIMSVTYINSETGESMLLYMPLEEAQKEALLHGYKVTILSQSMTVSPEDWAVIEAELGSAIESGMVTTELPVDESQIAQLKGSIVNSSFFNNYAKSAKGEAKGGAIYTNEGLSIAADNGVSVFSGNYVEDKNGKRPEAIYVDNPAASLILQAKNEGVILFDDQINGQAGYNLKLTGDNTGKVILNNDIINAKIDLNEVTLQLGREDVLNQSQELNLSSGYLSMVNGTTGTMHLPLFTLNGAVNTAVDADLANKTMDRITADRYSIAEDSKLNVDLINLLSDAKEDKTDIQFAEGALAGKVSYTGENPIAYSKIYKYDVSYNPQDGFFTFMRGSSSNPSENYNPVVLAPAVTSQSAGYSTQVQVFNYAFQHSDNFMNLPYFDRLAYSRENQYALVNDATVGPYSPIFTRINQGGYWVKPYVSFENIPLKNGPTVDNISYGSLVGYDSPLTPIRNGFERVLTGYIGYNGASQSYPGVDTYQNGGLLGGTLTLYKGNFFNATTLSAGANVGESSNMYGHENYTMLMAGIGNKFGYNFEFQRGKYILQPSMLMSYSFINTFDYTNSAGTRMTSDPLHAIQLSPGVKFVMNTQSGWQPYAAVNMVWNIFTGQKVMADNVRLPSISIKPYVQYGLGIQKLIKDKFLAFGQAMVSNGGRNGISFSFGLRWLLGRE